MADNKQNYDGLEKAYDEFKEFQELQKDFEYANIWNADYNEQNQQGDIYKFQYPPQNDAQDQQKNQENKIYHLEKAVLLCNQGNFEESIQQFECYLMQNQDNYVVWRILGKLLQDQDQDTEAIAAFRQAVKLKNEDLESLYLLGVSCCNMLYFDEGCKYLTTWLNKNPKYQAVKSDKQATSINELIEQFNEILKQNEDDYDLISCLALLYFYEKQYDQSLQYFKKALELDPNNYRLLNKLGATQQFLEQADQAEKYYQQASVIRPKCARVLVNKAINQVYQNNSHKALQYLNSALKLNSKALHVWTYYFSVPGYEENIDLINSRNLTKLIEKYGLPEELEQEPSVPYQVSNELYLFGVSSNQLIGK